MTLIRSEDSAHGFFVKFSPSVCVAVVVSLTREVAVWSCLPWSWNKSCCYPWLWQNIQSAMHAHSGSPPMIIILLVIIWYDTEIIFCEFSVHCGRYSVQVFNMLWWHIACFDMVYDCVSVMVCVGVETQSFLPCLHIPYCPEQVPTPQSWHFCEVLRVTAHHAKFLRFESEGRSAELT